MKKNIYLLIIAFASLFFLNSCSKDVSLGGSNIGTGTGTGGSLARFTIAGDYLYVVDGSNLYTYQITDATQPTLLSSIYIGMEIETIYPYNGNLYIGSRSAMYIYSLENPSQPVQKGFASHLRACDPVVAQENFAYVTVRSQTNGSPCGGTMNALMIYNVRNLENPQLVNSVQLTNPHGLGIKSNYLYVCDDKSGLKVFNVSNSNYPELLTTKTGYTFYDVIPYEDVLICMVDGGMIIYDITTPENPEFVAKTF